MLNANFFTGGRTPEGCAHEPDGLLLLRSSLAALGEVVGRCIKLTERQYNEAVAEFALVCSSAPSVLGYGLRTWFLLLMYDGINLFAKEEKLQPLSSFTEPELRPFALVKCPSSVQTAARAGINLHKELPYKVRPLSRAQDVL